MITFRENVYICSSEITVGLISGKWKILILAYLEQNTFRYNELLKQMPGATHKVLTQQLKELERDELIVRQVYPVVPPKVEYYLTEKGRQLIPVLYMLRDYGADYVNNSFSG